MKAQIIEKHGKKEFAVIPYQDFLRMQEELEDYHDLRELRKAKVDPKNQQGRPFNVVATELGLTKRKPNETLQRKAKNATAEFEH